MAKIGDTEVKGGIQTTVTNIDPETGQITWDVEYSADYQKLFKDITDLMKTAKEVADITGEAFFKDHYLDIRKRRNELRTYLRNNKTKEYARIKGLDETSTTGGGNSFSAQAGAGAQYATPNAFSKNKKGKYANGGMYTKKFGYKLVDPEKLAKNSKAIDTKYLWGKK
jgi:hypothetical protein